ncbi:hypothetical protein L9F63_028139, partial [Diploptera punctata]
KKSIHAVIIFETYPRCRTLKTSIMFSVYAEKRNLIESTKEFNWKNRRIGVILRVADVFVYADENNGSGFIAENSGSPVIGIDPLIRLHSSYIKSC